MLYEEGYFHLGTPIAQFIPAFQDVKVLKNQMDLEAGTEPWPGQSRSTIYSPTPPAWAMDWTRRPLWKGSTLRLAFCGWTS